MHESSLLRHIFAYLDKEQSSSTKKIKKLYICLSELGGISEGHFREYYKKESAGTKWENLELETKKIPYGPELEITRLDFE